MGETVRKVTLRCTADALLLEGTNRSDTRPIGVYLSEFAPSMRFIVIADDL